MSWVKAKNELFADPRTIRLAIRLGINRHEAAGIILQFRLWAAFTIELEDISDILAGECAVGIEYPIEKSEALWEALQFCGFIIPDGNRLLVADWDSDIVPVLNEIARNARKQTTYRQNHPKVTGSVTGYVTMQRRKKDQNKEEEKEPAAKPAKKKESVDNRVNMGKDFGNVWMTQDYFDKMVSEHGQVVAEETVKQIDAWKETKKNATDKTRITDMKAGADSSKAVSWALAKAIKNVGENPAEVETDDMREWRLAQEACERHIAKHGEELWK